MKPEAVDRLVFLAQNLKKMSIVVYLSLSLSLSHTHTHQVKWFIAWRSTSISWKHFCLSQDFHLSLHFVALKFIAL